MYQDIRSSPFENLYVWTYNISIKNKGVNSIQLLNRHWKIIDSTGQIKEVIGAGVVGVQPSLAVDEEFEYVSEASLSTPSGIMVGSYEMVTSNGEIFNVDVPTFSLDCPHIDEPMN